MNAGSWEYDFRNPQSSNIPRNLVDQPRTSNTEPWVGDGEDLYGPDESSCIASSRSDSSQAQFTYAPVTNLSSPSSGTSTYSATYHRTPASSPSFSTNSTLGTIHEVTRGLSALGIQPAQGYSSSQLENEEDRSHGADEGAGGEGSESEGNDYHDEKPDDEEDHLRSR